MKKANICKEIRQKHRFLGAFVRDIYFVLYRWSWWWESNPQPSHYEWDALPLSHISNLAFLFYHGSGHTSSVGPWKPGNDGIRMRLCRIEKRQQARKKLWSLHKYYYNRAVQKLSTVSTELSTVIHRLSPSNFGFSRLSTALSTRVLHVPTRNRSWHKNYSKNLVK